MDIGTRGKLRYRLSVSITWTSLFNHPVTYHMNLRSLDSTHAVVQLTLNHMGNLGCWMGCCCEPRQSTKAGISSLFFCGNLYLKKQLKLSGRTLDRHCHHPLSTFRTEDGRVDEFNLFAKFLSLLGHQPNIRKVRTDRRTIFWGTGWNLRASLQNHGNNTLLSCDIFWRVSQLHYCLHRLPVPRDEDTV